MTIKAMAAQEREDFADFLASLSPEQWEAPTLCEGWSVRDVAAHVVSYDDVGVAGLLKQFVRGRFTLGGINEVSLAEHRGASPEELVERIRRHATPSGLTARFDGRVGLVDTLVHHQDVRRPLGLRREVPAERLRTALPFALVAPPTLGPWHVRGVRLVATDLDWSAGKGPEARGPGEAVLLAITGRRSVASELDGPGARILAERLG